MTDPKVVEFNGEGDSPAPVEIHLSAPRLKWFVAVLPDVLRVQLHDRISEEGAVAVAIDFDRDQCQALSQLMADFAANKSPASSLPQSRPSDAARETAS